MFLTLTRVSNQANSGVPLLGSYASVSHQGLWGVLALFCLGCGACSAYPSSEHTRQTNLKTVTDSKHLLQLVPLASSEFVFETCTDETSEDQQKAKEKKCVIAFVTPQGKPVTFRATDIQHHRDEALGSLETLVDHQVHSEIADATAGGFLIHAANYLTPGLAADTDFLEEISDTGISVKDASSIIRTKENAGSSWHPL